MCAAVKVDPGQEICDAEPPPVIALDGFQRENSPSSVGIFGSVAFGGKISHGELEIRAGVERLRGLAPLARREVEVLDLRGGVEGEPPRPGALERPLGTQLWPGAEAGTDGFYYACLEKTTIRT